MNRKKSKQFIKEQRDKETKNQKKQEKASNKKNQTRNAIII